MNWRHSSAALSAAGLFFGYVVAALTTRSLGGVVLVVLGLAAFVAWLRGAGMNVAWRLGVLYLALFALSHVLALFLGAWTSVVTVSLVMAVASWWFVDARMERSPAKTRKGAVRAGGGRPSS